jgi:multicomponent Na+:H+ antiporter subunit C
VSYLPYALAAWVCVVGIFGIVTSRNLIHLALCLTVTQSSTYLLLLAVGYVKGGGPPIYKGVTLQSREVDPIVQALTLTDIVVEATVSALLFTFAIQAQKRFGTIDPERLDPLKG